MIDILFFFSLIMQDEWWEHVWIGKEHRILAKCKWKADKRVVWMESEKIMLDISSHNIEKKNLLLGWSYVYISRNIPMCWVWTGILCSKCFTPVLVGNITENSFFFLGKTSLKKHHPSILCSRDLYHYFGTLLSCPLCLCRVKHQQHQPIIPVKGMAAGSLQPWVAGAQRLKPP